LGLAWQKVQGITWKIPQAKVAEGKAKVVITCSASARI
jgi:hypothetical protein